MRKKNKPKNKFVQHQSDVHNIVKAFALSNSPNINKKTQQKLHNQRKMIRVVMVDGKAYWVKENIFYVSNIQDGDPDLETAKPVDTSTMSKPEIEKLLVILDSLKSGGSDDSSSSRN